MKGFSKILERVQKDMNDILLISLLKNDPQKGLRTLIEIYHRLVGAITCRILFDREQDIEECIADTFISVWKSSETLDISKGSIKSFVTTTARNTAISRYRKLQKHKVVISLADDITDILDICGESEIESYINNDSLKELITELPEPSREILIRRYFFCESIKEIADHFLLNEKQVKNKLYQTKLIIKKQILKGDLANG